VFCYATSPNALWAMWFAGVIVGVAPLTPFDFLVFCSTMVIVGVVGALVRSACVKLIQSNPETAWRAATLILSVSTVLGALAMMAQGILFACANVLVVSVLCNLLYPTMAKDPNAVQVAGSAPIAPEPAAH